MSPEFALSRVEAVGDDRLEVEGTWSGVRGVRFVRPALVVRDEARDRDRTLLATLDHKPWPAEEGRPWTAAFPWEGAAPDVASLELAVTPSIVVPLGEREPEPEPERVAAAPPRPAEVRARRITDHDERLASAREERDAARAERDAALAERDRLAATLEDARREVAARPSREAVRGELRQRDEALAARDAALAERDAAVAARGAARRWRSATPRAPSFRRPPNAPRRASASRPTRASTRSPGGSPTPRASATGRWLGRRASRRPCRCSAWPASTSRSRPARTGRRASRRSSRCSSCSCCSSPS